MNEPAIYLDHAATTPVRPEVRQAMQPFLSERFGNPSSMHRWGQEARAQLEGARARLARVIGAAPSEIVFTRGGTEADNLAVLGLTRADPRRALVCSAIEHRAVLAAARRAELEGAELHLLPADGDGVVDASMLPSLLRSAPSAVSLMWVNNEVGTVQPVTEVAEACAAEGVPFHTDAIQALGKVPVRVDGFPVSLLSLSAHKVGGPKGTGALFVRKGVRLVPLVHGGGHERGLRAGTEDVAGAVGLALAAELAEKERVEQMARLGRLRDRLEEALRARVPDLWVNGSAAERVATISNLSVPGTSSESLLLSMDLEGLAVSSGSACSSGAVAPSHVLTAMGIPAELAGPSVRFSFGRETTADEVERATTIFPAIVERLRALSPR